MASPSGSKPKKGLRSFLKETLHVRSRSKSPSQPSGQLQQPDSEDSARLAKRTAGDVAQLSTKPNAAWARLQRSLAELRDSSGSLPSLALAIETLLSNLGRLESTAKNWQSYEGLATSLATTSDSLSRLVREHESTPLSKAALFFISSIQQRAIDISVGLKEGTGRADQETKADRKDMAALCSQIEVLFQQLGRFDSSKWPTYDSSSPSDPLRQSCTEGTCTGILTSLYHWIYSPGATSICWISGRAGTGKTTIAHTFCNRADTRNELGASLFYSHTVAERDIDLTSIIKAIAGQLAQYSASFRRALWDTWTEEPETISKDATGLFEHMIRTPLEKAKDAMPERTVVAIDGLDERDSRGTQDAMIDILFKHQVPLRLLLTSRRKPGEYGDKTSNGRDFTIVDLDITERSIMRADIQRYFEAKLGSISLSPAQLEQLADRTDMLFLCAAILVRFINIHDPRSTPHDRLELVLSMTLMSTHKHAYIDALYTAILRSILTEDVTEDEREDTRAVLWTVLFAQEAIGVETVATLAGIDDTGRVRSALHPLQPVLHESEESGLVSAMHGSFPEYMLNSERSGVFLFDVAEHSRMMAERCFLVMKGGLRFNICGLESSFVRDRDVEDLERRIDEKILPTLGYACRHWASHVELAAACDRVVGLVDEFLSYRLLFWMEALNLRREIRCGVMGLRKVRQWVKLIGTSSPELVTFVEDTHDFVSSFAGNAVSQSTPHIYISALPFCGRSSQVYRRYSRRTTGLLSLTGDMMKHRETAALSTWKYRPLSVTYSPDGNWLGFGRSDGSAGIVDAYTGVPLVAQFQAHNEPVVSVCFSPDGTRFATGSRDNTIRIWNAADGAPLSTSFEGHTYYISSIAFSPDGTLIAFGVLDGAVRIWNVENGTTIVGPLGTHVFSRTPIALSPDRSQVAASSVDRSVLLWNISVKPPSVMELKGHTSFIETLAFSPDGQKLVSGSDDSTIRVWNVSDGTLAKRLTGHTMASNSVAVSPDGKHIASGSGDCTMRVWDINAGTLAAGPFPAADHIFRVAFSPDGTRVITGSAPGGMQIWSVREGVFPPNLLPTMMLSITSIGFSPSDSRIHSTSTYGLCIRDANDGSLLTESSSGAPSSASSRPLSPDGVAVAVFLDDHSIEVLGTEDGSSIAGPLVGHTNLVTCAMFSPDGTYLVTGSKDCTVRVWSLPDGRPAEGPFVGHTAEVTLVSVSADSLRVLSFSAEDQSVRVWNVRDSLIEMGPGDPSDPDGSQTRASQSKAFDGWKVGDDGWVSNSEGSLVFWIPPEFVPRPAPHTELMMSRFGSLSVPKQQVLLGDEWDKCYVTD